MENRIEVANKIAEILNNNEFNLYSAKVWTKVLADGRRSVRVYCKSDSGKDLGCLDLSGGSVDNSRVRDQVTIALERGGFDCKAVSFSAQAKEAQGVVDEDVAQFRESAAQTAKGERE